MFIEMTTKLAPSLRRSDMFDNIALLTERRFQILRSINMSSLRDESYSVHRVEEIFALRVDAHAEFLTFASQPLLQIRGALTRA